MKLRFLSSQPKDWRKNTDKWLNLHFGECTYTTFYVSEPNAKLCLLDKNIKLIDDYPKFLLYKHILLIDRDYNIKVKAYNRFKGVDTLHRYIIKVREGKK